ncbi:uncharacterized protein MAM_01227 [Metarhizium album ARSEF 1941]|uniref:Uncharacterized protein n=1 Tax=Metarhizium album (strain ARSEF 1941) TaxID=1081103 RepID=A0A0B2X2F3_METAS|nr:uncharacterized protein MAM_01227 [Metarhizium album ARSEF 1941]KHO00449.1 hypothetical protein MAM_01227 [Metarhizium album ARSEF 1941]
MLLSTAAFLLLGALQPALAENNIWSEYPFYESHYVTFEIENPGCPAQDVWAGVWNVINNKFAVSEAKAKKQVDLNKYYVGFENAKVGIGNFTVGFWCNGQQKPFLTSKKTFEIAQPEPEPENKILDHGQAGNNYIFQIEILDGMCDGKAIRGGIWRTEDVELPLQQKADFPILLAKTWAWVDLDELDSAVFNITKIRKDYMITGTFKAAFFCNGRYSPLLVSEAFEIK